MSCNSAMNIIKRFQKRDRKIRTRIYYLIDQCKTKKASEVEVEELNFLLIEHEIISEVFKLKNVTLDYFLKINEIMKEDSWYSSFTPVYRCEGYSIIKNKIN